MTASNKRSKGFLRWMLKGALGILMTIALFTLVLAWSRNESISEVLERRREAYLIIPIGVLVGMAIAYKLQRRFKD